MKTTITPRHTKIIALLGKCNTGDIKALAHDLARSDRPVARMLHEYLEDHLGGILASPPQGMSPGKIGPRELDIGGVKIPVGIS